MALYEHVFLARQDVSSQQVEALVEQFKAIVEQSGGKVAKIEPWGLKSLSYRIRKNRKAHFTLLNIDAPPAAVAEIERQERINEDVLRFLTIRVEELEEVPSAMLQKRDRDDRGERGGFGDRGGFARPRRPWRPARRRLPSRPRSASRRWRRRGGDRWRSRIMTDVSPAAEPAAPSSAAARPARSPGPTHRRSTTRTCASCSATCPSAARSCRRGSPRCRHRSSANSPARSSGRASSVFCPT